MCVCLMCEGKAWDICVCKSDVRVLRVGYMCVSLMCEVQACDICVYMTDM
jgi:hypothetical protein